MLLLHLAHQRDQVLAAVGRRACAHTARREPVSAATAPSPIRITPEARSSLRRKAGLRRMRSATLPPTKA